ncbi:SDR family NAD(P)-dependent oxidoreductase [Bosea beijingensis]|uniref:SDR family NAD(P)-dependent oxidoreductase n=1 Tax=Bosea beijingensis TaxID=3068632 RepID=UPI0027411B40|nr:SDR family NAD(P)-dependent oxidoreductase [Bosea sp. REN20]
MTLQGQRALVTGGGRGLGRAIAAALTAAGARVSILGRDEATLREAIAAGVAADWATCDVRDEVSVSAALSQLGREQFFDIAIANAGAVETGPFMRSDGERFRRMLDINLIGTVNLFHATLPAMLEHRRGRLIAIASTAGHRGYPYVSAYTAAKHAVVGLVKSLALETARSGVTVNAVCPGYADTDMATASIENVAAKTGKSREEALSAMIKDNPQGRLIAPEEVAAAVLYLCGPGSDAVTGQSLMINGGEF